MCELDTHQAPVASYILREVGQGLVISHSSVLATVHFFPSAVEVVVVYVGSDVEATVLALFFL